MIDCMDLINSVLALNYDIITSKLKYNKYYFAVHKSDGAYPFKDYIAILDDIS